MAHIYDVAVFTWSIFQLFFYGLCFEVTNYFGCFHEGVDDKEGFPMKRDDLTQERCTTYCFYNDITYSVLTRGNECRCTEKLAHTQVEDNNCEEQCSGDAGSYCGGMKHHMYLTSCPRSRWGPRCMLPCHCFGGIQCPLLTGLCPAKRCVIGWVGRYCDVKIHIPTVSPEEATEPPYDMAPCPTGRFGKGCVYECHCMDGVCHVYSGMCIASTRCQQGWHGRRCDFRDGCASSPCRNNGTCRDYGKDFHCDCLPQFSGGTCAYINPCLSNPCQSGGTCVMYGNLYDCSCKADYYGILCEKYSPGNDSSSEEVEYLGCFRFLVEEKFLMHKRLWWGSNKRMSIGKCLRHCRERQFTYAGLQFGAACWCGEAYFTYGAVGEFNCNMTCNKDGAPRCGGKMVNSVYTVCPMGRYKLDCQSKCHCSGRQCNLLTGSCEDQPCIGGWTGVNCDQAEEKQLRRSLVLVIFLLAFAALVILLAFYDASTQLLKSRELRQNLDAMSTAKVQPSVGYTASRQAIAGTIPSTLQISKVGSTRGSTTKVRSKTASTSQISKVGSTRGSTTKVGSKTASTSQMSEVRSTKSSATSTKLKPTATSSQTTAMQSAPKKKSRLHKLLKQMERKKKKKKKKKEPAVKYGTYLQVPGAERRKRRKAKSTESPKDIIIKVPSRIPQPTK